MVGTLDLGLVVCSSLYSLLSAQGDLKREHNIKRSVITWSVILPYGSLFTVDLRYNNAHFRGSNGVLRNTDPAITFEYWILQEVFD